MNRITPFLDLIPIAIAPRAGWNCLATGKKVRVKDGPFSGLEGIVLQHREHMRMLISLDYQQGIAIEVNANLVEPV